LIWLLIVFWALPIPRQPGQHNDYKQQQEKDSKSVSLMSLMSLKAPQRRIYPLMGTESDEYGAIDLHRSDSSVVSEQPDAWICSQCSYLNCDGRNASCAMCGTKDLNKIREEKNKVQSQLWKSLGGNTKAKASLLEGDYRDRSNANFNPSEMKNESIERSPSLRVPLNGPRPGIEDKDADDEAQPSKPSTGRSAYLSHQNRGDSFHSDDSSVMNASVSSSTATVASAMNYSVDSTMSAMNNSVVSSTATVKISNSRQIPTPPNWQASPTRSQSTRVTDTAKEEQEERRRIRCPPSILSLPVPSRAPTSGIYSIDEEQKTCIPPSMRSMSHQEQKTCIPPSMRSMSHHSMPEVSTTTRSEFSIQSSRAEYSTNAGEDTRHPLPPLSVVREESQSSHFTDSTSVRTSMMSTYNDEPSQSMELGKALGEEIINNGGDDDEHADTSGEKLRSRRFMLIALGFVVLLISIILMATLIPQKANEGLLIVPSMSSTLAPTVSTLVVEDSAGGDLPSTPKPSSSPSLSPTMNNGIKLLAKVQGFGDNDRIGNDVSIGGPDGDLVAFVGNGMAGVGKFNALEKTWSTIEFLDVLFPVPESAQISLSTESDRVALAYDGKLEIHEYSPSLVKWIRVYVIGEGSLPTISNSTTATVLSGNGMFVAFVPPSTGIQMLRYNANLKNWIFDPVVTEASPDKILQVELSHDGMVLAILTEDGVEVKALVPESNIWEDFGDTIPEVKLAKAISLSGDGKTLAVTNRSKTILFSLVGDPEKNPLFIINQGGADISLNYSGNFLAIGSSSLMIRSDDLFSRVTLFRRSIDQETSKIYYEFLDKDMLPGDSLGASLSLLNRQSGQDESTFLAVGAPMDGQNMEGSIRFYQVQSLAME
jgi:hypothetical protein